MTLYQLGSDPEFEKCLPDTLAEEDPDPANLSDPKNYSNDAHDPGGMTMDGIIQREYDVFRKAQGLPTKWIKNITADEVRTIYHDSYWLPHCQECPAGLNLCLFDTNVNNGTHAGIVLLQRALAITDDGQWGPETALAVKLTAEALPLAIRHFYQKRAAYYQSLANFRYFGKDWMRRDADIQNWALAMATGT
jgi:lysozyme family protein